MKSNTHQIDPILRRKDVTEAVSLSSSTIYAMVAKGNFPRPIKLSNGGRASGWLLSEINTWKQSRLAERDGLGG